MVKEKIFSKKNLFVLAIISTIAIVLSILLYQYYESPSNQIFKVVAENVRSNARIQVHDLHTFASNADSLIDQQQNFSTLIIIVIGGLAISSAFLFLLWNKRLKAVVNSKTAELSTTNNSLIESNKQLAEANEQLKVHDKMQKEFINIAAHELRTPIQPIIGLSGVL